MYFGRFLSIDLDREGVDEYVLDEDIIGKFIGGKGLGAYILYKMLEKGVDPLKPDNLLLFMTGPLTGTGYPTSSRMCIVTKSPLTGLYTDAHVGGYFGPELRMCGYDGLIVKGASNEPIYLWVNNDVIEFRDASRIWGSGIEATVNHIRRETHDEAHVASIGPAGENMVRYACIVIDKDSDKWRSGIAGRGGVGAVMGSKRLKAIAVKARDKSRVKLFDENGFNNISREAYMKTNRNKFVRIRRQIGTSYWIEPMNTHGILPSLNFRRGYIEDAVGLYGTYLRDFVERIVTCYSCPISCGKIVRVKGGHQVKVEYEDIALLGSNNGLKDVMDVADAIHLCNDLGLDAISTGNVIGFAMECRENGLLEDGPCFGDKDGQLRLIKMIAYREGIGDILAEGVKRASEKIGGESWKYALHVKGLELPGYEPRSSWGMALAYATSDRGACHQRAWTTRAELSGILGRFSTRGIPEYVKNVQDERAAAFSLIVCDFLPEYDVKALYYAAGIDLTSEDLIKAGERIWNLIRLFNIREANIGRRDDTLPYRILNEPLSLPPRGEKMVRFTKKLLDEMLDEYYRLRGWDGEGRPLPEKLIELGLREFI